jgi:enamine deaminase RidA (YjgF/YER057c/UK114 family)
MNVAAQIRLTPADARYRRSESPLRSDQCGTNRVMEHIITPGLEVFEDRWHFSHVVAARGLLLLSGVTGTGADGFISKQPAAQFDQAFVHLREYLEAAGASLGDVIEMTSYHVDLRRHLDAFVAAKDRYITAPYPAWSAIGVSDLITEGALVEIRAVAADPRARS